MRKLAAALTACTALLFASPALASRSLTDRLTRNERSVRVTSVPRGTASIHVAVMSDLSGSSVEYLVISAARRRFRPPPDRPVVDMQAWGPQGPIGGWAGRIATTPHSRQVPEEGPASEEEPQEGEGGEGQEPPPPLEEEEAAGGEVPGQIFGPIVVGVDSGGWGGSTFSDLAGGGIRYIRTSSSNAPANIPQMTAAGVHIATVIFGTGGTIGAIDPAAYAKEVVDYFQRYGRAGGLAVEVLNEPGGSWFWSDPTNYAAYARLAKAVHEGLATLPAGSRPAELCAWDGGQGGQDSFGRGIHSAGALPYCDGVTVHPYGGSGGQRGGALGDRANVERAHAESGLPVYVTEVGWPTALGQPSTGDSQQWTEAQQATNILLFVLWARTTGYVPMVIYFNYVDYGTNQHYGIETASRVHKLAFAALAAAAL